MPEPVPSPISDLDVARQRAEQLAVGRVRQGDALALEAIFTAYRRELLTLAERVVGARDVAEDVVQDVFTALWTRREQWQVALSLGAYLRRAVYNGAVNRAKHGARRQGPALEEVERATPVALADGATRADVATEHAELRAAIERAAVELPPRAREVFMLKRLHHFTNRQVADRLGITVNTVEIHMTRALAALRRRLADWRP